MVKTVEDKRIGVEIDSVKEVKNKFKWEWLEHETKVDIHTYKLGEFIRKADLPGKALCQLCDTLINYGARGRVALVEHTATAKHKKQLQTRKTNYSLGSFAFGVAPKESTSSSASANNVTTVAPLVPLGDRILHQQGMLLAVLAEHSLPFTMAPVLINVSKALASDKKALDMLSMDRTTASYKMRLGLGESIRLSIVDDLKSSFFSLNIDEATSSNQQRVLAILVSYFSVEQNKVVIKHLESCTLLYVNTNSVLKALDNLFQSNELPWTNLMSILMDSCAVMRGSKAGLVDIDGDVCHHLHNATKKFCSPFEKWVENLFNIVHTDFHWSTDLRDALSQICFMIGIAFSVPQTFVPHRWLSCYDVSVSTLRLFDAYTIFYFAFMSKADQTLYDTILIEIFKRHDVSKESIKEIRSIHQTLGAKKMTEEGKKRKVIAVDKVIIKRTRCILHFYTAALPLLKEYVCLFQSKTPLIHKLHDKQVKLFRNFLSCFMKPEVHTDLSVKQLKDVTVLNIADRKHLLDKKDLFIGKSASDIVRPSHKKDMEGFLQSVEDAYVACGSYLQHKLPLDNLLLRSMSALDPLARGHSHTSKLLRKLPEIVSNVLHDDELDSYDLDVRQYQTSIELPNVFDSEGNPCEFDKWWATVSGLKLFPKLTKMAMALMSCFHGPAVESGFNVMGDIIDPKSARMKVSTFSAIQTVKYSLFAENKTAVQSFCRSDILRSPVNRKLCNSLRTSRRRYGDEQIVLKQQREDKRNQLQIVRKESLSQRPPLSCGEEHETSS